MYVKIFFQFYMKFVCGVCVCMCVHESSLTKKDIYLVPYTIYKDI